MTEEISDKILEAYGLRDERGNSILESVGLGITLSGFFVDKPALGLAGLGFMALGYGSQHINNMKAYNAAKLDHLQNGKFTKLEH